MTIETSPLAMELKIGGSRNITLNAGTKRMRKEKLLPYETRPVAESWACYNHEEDDSEKDDEGSYVYVQEEVKR
jgi:hypothetical protein